MQYIIFLIFYCSFLFANLSSSALYIDKQQKYIYSANLDAGSISKVALLSGKLIKEIKLGSDIRRIAFNNDETIALATDYIENKIYILKNEKLKKTIKTFNKPHAVLYNKKNKVFYITIYEDNKLLVLDEKKLKIIQTIQIEQGPRGLAISEDSRLFVTHAFTGKVSIFKIEDKGLISNKNSKIIRLHSTQDIDEKKSQGVPVYLDDIEITPNGKQAWIPHILWNFDHPFQFQSIVFPTVSILDITPNKEKELKEQRKHLFKEINIVDNLNRTRIISNPWDLAFSPNGHKAYVTLAGSEDLLVFDIKRSVQRTNKGRQHRIRKKRVGSGAKAVEIYRHLPGKNPRALILDKSGKYLYIQNAMSLDMTQINTNGEENFSRVSLNKAVFSKLVKKDPLSKEIREGKTLFHLANSNRYKNNPITGDFWMSCSSCHFEGFNSSNRFLIEYSKVDKFKDAVRGHRNLDGYISKNYIADYIKIVQQTQGGFGVTTGFGLKAEDPYKPSLETKKMLEALQSYITLPENLPFLSTWLKLEDNKKTAHKQEWINSASCKNCHKEIFYQWANSSHGTTMEHPYYKFHEDFAAKAEGDEFRTFCRGCHMPQLLLTNNTKEYTLKNRMKEKDAQFLVEALKKSKSVVEGGTSCFFCHRISKAENAGGNADLQVNLKDRNIYYFEKSSSSLAKWLNEKLINTNPKVHKQSYTNEQLYSSSLYCATCHNEFAPGTAAKINDNYNEWLNSSFNNPNEPKKNKTCIDCHMNSNIYNFDKKVQGYSTKNGSFKKNIRTHHFTGANYYLAQFRSEEHKKLSIDLLKTATKLEILKEKKFLNVRVHNIGAGHRFPGGARREIWLEVTIEDKNKNIVYTNGYLRDNKVPKDAKMFRKVLGLKDGQKAGLHFWRYEKMLEDTRIPADGYKDNFYTLPNELSYPITIKTRLLFRAFSPALTNKVREYFKTEDIPYAEVIEIQNAKKSFKK